MGTQHFNEDVAEGHVVVVWVVNQLQCSGTSGDDVKLLEQTHHFVIVHDLWTIGGVVHLFAVLSGWGGDVEGIKSSECGLIE
ncbi:hypothetical protein [Corynebacterium cystitidis]|uniref:hypothetical protein n=1 Tax=Corynebacterium cystitidis TaxID=35757 RepID=UPI00211F37EC|nr:hypothetical protein [Corynebacterium cystitidis]